MDVEEIADAFLEVEEASASLLKALSVLSEKIRVEAEREDRIEECLDEILFLGHKYNITGLLDALALQKSREEMSQGDFNKQYDSLKLIHSLGGRNVF